MSDYNLGTARGVIEIEYNGNGAKQATADMRGAGNAAEDASRKTSRAGTHLLAGGAAIAGGLALAVKSAADFEKQLSNVAAVSGATDSEMEGLRNKALQLGKDTQFSASESAQAIEELVKAGLSVQDVMNGAADATVNLAAAGEISMPEAATIASNAMNQFGLAAEDMVGVADNIAGAANASAIDVKEFGYSLSQVGAVANLAGANFADTATAIALLGNAGIKGSDAGTSLKSMLNNLQPTTIKQIDLMTELGIVTEDGANRFYDAQGNLKGLADVSQVLQTSLKGMTKQQKQATLETLFGSDAIRAAAVLADNGAKGFDKMAESMSKVSAEDVAKTKMDNLAGSVEQLKGSLETLMIMVGTPLLHAIRGLVDGLTGFLNLVLELPGPVLEAATTFLGLVSAGLLLAGVILKVRAAIQAGGAAAALLSGPIGLIIVAIAALVAAFVYFYKNNEKFRTFVQQMAKAIKGYLVAAIKEVMPYLKEFGDFIKDVFQASLPYLRQFGTFMQEAFQKALPYIRQAQAFITKFKVVFIAAFASMVLPILAPIIALIALVKAFKHFYESSEQFRNAVNGIVTFAKQLADLFLNNVLPVIKEVASMIGTALVGAFQKVLPEIQKMAPVIADLVVSLKEFFAAIMGSPAVQLLINILKVLATLLVGTILPLVLRVGGIFARVFIEVLGTALKTAMGIIRGALNIIIGIIKIFTGLLTGNWRKAWDGVKQVLRGAVGIIGSLLRGLLKTAGSIIRGLGSLLLAGIKAIPGLLRGAGGLFAAAGRFLIQQFADGMKNAAGIIEGIATNVWNFVRGLLNGAISRINAALSFTIDPPGPGSVTINPPDIPALASGGVARRTQLAWVGDTPNDGEAITPLKQLWGQMDRVYKAGRMRSAGLESASAGRGGRSGGMGSATSRIVSGSLAIDSSGRAFITGVAEDVFDRFQSDNDRRDRMSF